MCIDFEIKSYLVIDFCRLNSIVIYVDMEYCFVNLLL